MPQDSNTPMKRQFRQVQLSLNQTEIAKENKGLLLVGGLARLRRKKTKSQQENMNEALKIFDLGKHKCSFTS